MQNVVQARLSDLGEYNILVEGLSDKVYLELAAQLHRDATGVDLLENGRVRIVAGRGTKTMGAGVRLAAGTGTGRHPFVVMLDGDDAGEMAAERHAALRRAEEPPLLPVWSAPTSRTRAARAGMSRLRTCCPGRCWKPTSPSYPEAVEEHYQRGDVHKVVIQGKPVQRDGQVFDYKMMLTEFVKQRATAEDMTAMVTLLRKARSCMGLK